MTQRRTRQVDLTGSAEEVGTQWRRLVATPGQSVTVDQEPVRHRDGTVTMYLTVTEVVAARPAERPAPARSPARRAMAQLRRPAVSVPASVATLGASYGLYRLALAVWQAVEAGAAWVQAHAAPLIGLAFGVVCAAAWWTARRNPQPSEHRGRCCVAGIIHRPGCPGR